MRRPPALTVWRPWPMLMQHAGKDPENRVWNTHYRGDLLIHAAIGTDPTALSFARDITKSDPSIDLSQIPDDPADHPIGIVGVVELYDVCVFSTNNPTVQCPNCPLWAGLGYYHWRLRNYRPFPEPVPHPGKQRLWAVKDQAWPDVYQQLKAVNHG